MPLQGRRVLIAEDEAMLVLELQDMLNELGCAVQGRAATLPNAVQQARELAIDIAVLDVNLGGARVDPVADALAGRGIPFVFATGYGKSGVPPRHAAAPTIGKPYRIEDLRAALLQAVGRADAAAQPAPSSSNRAER